MGSITTGMGLFSGIDTGTLIQQLLAIESRPKLLAQARIAQLQRQQAAFLDLNSALGGLKSAASALRLQNIFDSATATSSDPAALTATAGTDAVPGSYAFIVNRLVTTQQWLSRGFADADATGVGATSFTFEPAAGRLDRDTPLADLNGGEGVARGTIVITDANGASATIDLSTAATVGEVLDAINNATGVAVTATVQDGRLVVSHDEGLNIRIVSGAGHTTAASLGIEQTTLAGPTVTGSALYYLSESTPLALLNDGNGVYIRNQVSDVAYDFSIIVGGTRVDVNLGDVYVLEEEGFVAVESTVTTIGGALERINEALEATLGDTSVRASINADGTGLTLVDSAGRAIEVVENPDTGRTSAADLGLLTSAPATGTLEGRRLIAGLNSTLVRTLNGGAGVGGDGTISITGRDGVLYSFTIDPDGSVSDLLAAFAAQTGGLISAALDERGTGIVLTDHTGGTGNLIVSGTTAESLGLATDPAGVAGSVVESGNLQHQYITYATRLSEMNAGRGVGTGTFTITDSLGATAVVTITSEAQTLDDLIKNINSRPTRVRARLNDQGDGIELYEEDDGAGGSLKIKVEDTNGGVAKALGIAGEAAGVGTDNVIRGTAEKTVEFEATDTLRDIAAKINNAGAGVAATIINDGSASTPFRLSLTATASGSAGRVIVDTGGLDLGLDQLDAGHDAKVFFGSTDPARAVLLTSSTNVLDGVVQGVSIDLLQPSDTPVTLTVSRDVAAVEAGVGALVDAFNAAIDKINVQTRYVKETNTKGPLLGDSTAQSLRAALYAMVQSDAIGVTGPFQNLAQVGVAVGSGGKLEFDRDAFRAAFAQDPEAVADVFAARVLGEFDDEEELDGGIIVRDPDPQETFTSLGVAGRLEELVETYTDTIDGILTLKTRGIDEQIRQQNARIAAFDARLETRRQVLERQFLAMEQAIAQLQSMQGALGAIRMPGL